jgi:predicted DnaQ family exonuclease/DinG family helicase
MPPQRTGEKVFLSFTTSIATFIESTVMPRLSDLLPDKLKAQLIAETKKTNAPPAKPRDRRPADRAAVPAVTVPDFVAVDVETTGLDFSSDHIIEIGAVKFTAGKIAGEFSSFVNPNVPIPPIITDLTGITGADTSTAPQFSAVAPNLLAFIGDLPVIGHQVIFDLTFINKSLERAGLHTIGEKSLDTALLSKIVLESGMRFSLKSVSSSLEVTLDNAHRALYDARATGEVAVLLIPMLSRLPQRVRQTMAAAAPASFLKTLIFQSLGDSRPRVIVRQRGEATSIARLPSPDGFTEIDPDAAAKVFSPGGALEKVLPAFTLRESQRTMATEVAGTFNTQSILVAEAGTGTGKSLAYLVPAALWALENQCRVLVATRTRTLQDQLLTKELPLVNKMTGGKLLFSTLKGRGNYLCLNRFERLLRGEAGNLSVRERFSVLPLIPWVESTESGDIEEQNQFNPKWFQKVWDLISAEGRGCEGHRCQFFKTCFLQQARAKAAGSHIVAINHALFFAELGSANSFLGPIDAIIFDEAHHLEGGGHRYLRVELDTNRVSLFLEELNNLVQSIANIKGSLGIATCGKDLKSQLKRVRKYSQSLLESVQAWARLRSTDTRGGAEYQVTVKPDDFASNVEAPAFNTALEMLRDLLYQLKQELAADGGKDLDLLREATAGCQERTSQLLADLGYLIAARTEDHAFWAEGNFDKGWTKLCGVPLDIASLLATVWQGCRGPIVFTSATLSVARSVDYFFNAVGLNAMRERTAVSYYASPFGSHQAIMGAIKNAPEPDSREFPGYLASIIGELHASLSKNILVLFTANAMLSETYAALRSLPSVAKESILAQNISGGRFAILEQFKVDRRMILLGTDSFWEGIDVPGEACEIVIIPRLPFPVPTHPLTMAIAEKMTRINGESFMSYAIPEAVIRFRQGCGRLIRSATDRGALIVLDQRIINKGYGKHFTRSLDGAFLTFADKAAAVDAVKSFFVDGTPPSSVTYVPFDEV